MKLKQSFCFTDIIPYSVLSLYTSLIELCFFYLSSLSLKLILYSPSLCFMPSLCLYLPSSFILQCVVLFTHRLSAKVLQFLYELFLTFSAVPYSCSHLPLKFSSLSVYTVFFIHFIGYVLLVLLFAFFCLDCAVLFSYSLSVKVLHFLCALFLTFSALPHLCSYLPSVFFSTLSRKFFSQFLCQITEFSV